MIRYHQRLHQFLRTLAVLPYHRGLRRCFCTFAVFPVVAFLFRSFTASAVVEPDVHPDVAAARQSHSQTSTISVGTADDKMRLVNFCVCKDGRLLAITTSRPDDANQPLLYAPEGDANNTQCEVRILRGDGQEIRRFSVPFVAQAISANGDVIYIGGSGQLASFSFDGTKLKQGEAPQVAALQQDPEALEQTAADDLKTQKESIAEQVKTFQDIVTQLEQRLADDKSDDSSKEKDSVAKPNDDDEDIRNLPPKQMQEIYKQQLQSLQAMAKQLEDKTVKDVVKEIVAAAQKVNSITASEQDVFLSCRAATGYGFAVWRTTHDFTEPKRIVDQLVGCCGQMDCQCVGDELFIAENARHRVAHYDREGKMLGQFGKNERSGIGINFGGCCNPMNLCSAPSGDLYVSESNGVVKRFNAAGEFRNVAGIAQVQAGCKNSAVGVSPDDSKIYYIDISNSRIIVLTKQESGDTAQVLGAAKVEAQ